MKTQISLLLTRLLLLILLPSSLWAAEGANSFEQGYQLDFLTQDFERKNYDAQLFNGYQEIDESGNPILAKQDVRWDIVDVKYLGRQVRDFLYWNIFTGRPAMSFAGITKIKKYYSHYVRFKIQRPIRLKHPKTGRIQLQAQTIGIVLDIPEDLFSFGGRSRSGESLAEKLATAAKSQSHEWRFRFTNELLTQPLLNYSDRLRDASTVIGFSTRRGIEVHNSRTGSWSDIMDVVEPGYLDRLAEFEKAKKAEEERWLEEYYKKYPDERPKPKKEEDSKEKPSPKVTKEPTPQELQELEKQLTTAERSRRDQFISHLPLYRTTLKGIVRTPHYSFAPTSELIEIDPVSENELQTGHIPVWTLLGVNSVPNQDELQCFHVSRLPVTHNRRSGLTLVQALELGLCVKIPSDLASQFQKFFNGEDSVELEFDFSKIDLSKRMSLRQIRYQDFEFDINDVKLIMTHGEKVSVIHALSTSRKE